jgi:protocatechuate 3,4-dioxygenase beta subunit
MVLMRLSRRALIGAGAFSLLGGLSLRGVEAPQSPLPPTPQCADDDDLTPRQTEGPYFTPNSPERTNLIEDGMPGERIALAGFVLDRRCRPVDRALLDLWHCDSTGEYDTQGYRLRGHQFSDAQGRFVFETIVPGKYPGRTRHYHIKVQAPGQKVLTTQLYFPGEPGNEDDSIFNDALLLDIPLGRGPNLARYDFVLDIS